MSDLQYSVGLKGKLTIEIDGVDVIVGGITGWDKPGDEREIIDIPTTFGITRAEKAIGVKQALTVSWSGLFITTEDAGQAALRNAYNEEIQLERNQIKFYVYDGLVQGYWTPASGSYIQITKIDEVSQTADGVASYAGSGLVVDELVYVYNAS